MKVFSFVLLAVVLLAVCPVLRTEAFYGNCSIPQQYFFLAPFTGMSTVEIIHSLDSLNAQGVSTSVSVTSGTELVVVIQATADHVLNVDFSALDASTTQVAITDSFGAGASSLPSGQALALSLAAAGLVAGTASGKPGMGLGVASLAASAAVGLGLFGPLVSADSTKCPISYVQVVVYIPGTVRNYTINSGSQECNVPYSLNTTTSECTVCNSQFYVDYQGTYIPYPCVAGATECCAGEFCAAYTIAGNTLTHCCAQASQINSTTCCPILTPVYNPYYRVCLAVCTNTTTGSLYPCSVGEICSNNTCTSTSAARSLEEEFGFAVPDAAETTSMNVATMVPAGLERQAFPVTSDLDTGDVFWSADELAEREAETLP